MTVTGEPIYFVPSSKDAETWYRIIATVDGFRCNCSAGQHGKICTHRALARAAFLAENNVPAEAEPPRQPAPKQSAQGYHVLYEARRGRRNRCDGCGEHFTEGEAIVLRNGQAFHPECDEPDDEGTVKAALLQTNNRPVSIYK
jgi:hypothetical protein